jgi:hypothetical protein
MWKRGISNDGFNRLAKRAQEAYPGDNSVETELRVFIKRLETLLNMAKGDEEQKSLFWEFGDTETHNRDETIKEFFIELVDSMMNSSIYTGDPSSWEHDSK